MYIYIYAYMFLAVDAGRPDDGVRLRRSDLQTRRVDAGAVRELLSLLLGVLL